MAMETGGRWAVAVALLVTFWLPLEAGAQVQPAARVLTLREAQELALSQNLELQSARRSLEAAATLATQVRTQWRPQVVAFATYIHYDHDTLADFAAGFEALVPWFIGVSAATGVTPPDLAAAEPVVVQHQNDYQAGGSVSMSFAPQWLAQLDSAELTYEIGEAGIDEAQLRLGMAVTDLYYGLVTLRESREVAARNVETRRLSFELTQARLEVGRATPLDLLQSQLALTQAEAAERRLGYAYDALRIQVAAILQTDPDFEVARPSQPPRVSDTGGVLDAARLNRPDLRGAEMEVELAEAAADEVRLSWLPTVAAAFNLLASRTTVFSDEAVRWNFTLGATWPLFVGGIRFVQLDQFEAEEMAAQYHASEVETRIATEIDRAMLRREELEMDLELANEQQRLAATALDVANALRDEGMGTQLDVVTAETALFAAELAITENQIAIARQNAHINSLTGVLWQPE